MSISPEPEHQTNYPSSASVVVSDGGAEELSFAPKLPARRCAWISRILAEPERAERFIAEFGSPVNLFSTQAFARNAEQFLEVFASQRVQGKLFFARKANRLGSFVEVARDAGLGVDVASEKELEDTLSLGVPGTSIIVTAVGKTEALVDTAIHQRALLVVDCFDELRLVLQRSSTLGKLVRVGLRFSGFSGLFAAGGSRFGFHIDEAEQLIAFLTAERDAAIKIEILHTHLDKYDLRDRVIAGEQLLRLSDRFAAAGFSINAIDLGGGIPMSYAQAPGDWIHFKSEMKRAVLGERTSFVFAGDSLGLTAKSGSISGELGIYPAWGDCVKADFIEAILNYPLSTGELFSRELRARNLSIYFEPGRSLLDDCGATLASVAFAKRDARGNPLVGVRMNRTQMCPFRAELPIDPILIEVGEQQKERDWPAYVVGNMCAESDFIYRRCLSFNRMLRAGDLLLFPNSAGYFVHHQAVGTHGSAQALNLVIDEESLEVLRCER